MWWAKQHNRCIILLFSPKQTKQHHVWLLLHIMFQYKRILNKPLLEQLNMTHWHTHSFSQFGNTVLTSTPVYADSDDDETLSLCVSIFTANLWLLGDVTVGCTTSDELGCWWDEWGECLLVWGTAGCRELDGDWTSPAFLLAWWPVDGECLELDPFDARCCRRGLVMWRLPSAIYQVRKPDTVTNRIAEYCN